jgi:transcriptional regulator GlxA family with amidase domain
VSVGHLNRVFQTAAGGSPGATIERIRLARAERLLARSSLTLEAVAESTGFADAYHLSRRFRRCFGMAPASYRRVVQGSEMSLPTDIVRVLPLVDRLSMTPFAWTGSSVRP